MEEFPKDFVPVAVSPRPFWQMDPSENASLAMAALTPSTVYWMQHSTQRQVSWEAAKKCSSSNAPVSLSTKAYKQVSVDLHE